MIAPFTIVAFIGYAVGCMVYVYRFRGRTRFASFSEYRRKGWFVFAPLNCLLYLFTEKRARRSIIDLAEFPELVEIQRNWETIRDEAVELYRQGYFEKTNEAGSAAYYDVGFRTFYKYGWSKFYLKWYGATHASASRYCPKTVAILSGVPSVNGAMFSLLRVGSKLTRHLDPVACSLRYHLGLVTPGVDTCFIDIDGQRYSWRDGDALLFDETYLHFAKNDSDTYRLILMCDVERPLHVVGRGVNVVYKALMRQTVVPNLEGDKRGLINRIFAFVSPVTQRVRRLKSTNRPLYRIVSFSLNSLMIAAALGVVTGVLYIVIQLAEEIT